MKRMSLKVGDYVTLKRDNGGVQRITPSMEFDGVRKVKKVIASNVFVLENDPIEFWYERRSLYKVTEINDLKEKHNELKKLIFNKLMEISSYGDICGWLYGGTAKQKTLNEYIEFYKNTKKKHIIEILYEDDTARIDIVERLLKEDREEMERVKNFKLEILY